MDIEKLANDVRAVDSKLLLMSGVQNPPEGRLFTTSQLQAYTNAVIEACANEVRFYSCPCVKRVRKLKVDTL